MPRNELAGNAQYRTGSECNIQCRFDYVVDYLPRKDKRLSQPGWLTYRGQFTHISGHLSAAGRAQDRESSPVKDQRSTTVPRNQLAGNAQYRTGSKCNIQCRFDYIVD